MSFAERATAWNRRYNNAPAEWRFQFVLWSLMAVGTLNMLLTVSTGFPFGLLVLLGIAFIAAVRVPYVMGMTAEPAHLEPGTKFQIDGADWLIDLNHRYEALPETRRFWVFPAVLLIAGAINMMLTIRHAFPFGLLFLLALLALVLFRAPYAAGYLRAAEPVRPAAPDADPVRLAVPETEPVRLAASEPVLPPAAHETDPSPPVPRQLDQTPAAPHDIEPTGHANGSAGLESGT